MRGAGERIGLSYSVRVLPRIPVDRARLRMTLSFAVTDRLSVGLEANPLDDDYGPLVSWRVLDETEHRPALVVGTGSDRIGTPDGRAVFATFSKDIETLTALPVSPYVGLAYGEFDAELVEIGGLHVRWADGWRSTHLWDSENLHHTVDRVFEDGSRFGLVLAGQKGGDYLGVTFGGAL